MFPDYPDIVSVTQLLKMLGISRQLAYELINTGKIRALHIGNAFKIPKVCVIDYITSNFISTGTKQEDKIPETNHT